MKFSKSLLCSVTIGVLGTLAIAGISTAAQDVVALVGSVPITSSELQREMQQIMPFQMGFHSGMPQDKVNKVKEEAFSRLIERNLKVNYAIAEKITVESGELEKRLETVSSKFKSAAELEKALGADGLQALRASLYRQMLAEKAQESAVASKIHVSDADILAYYEENKAAFKRPKQFKASHILVKVDPSSNAEERAKRKQKAEDLAAKARSGEDFYNLAYFNSDDRTKFVGGDLGNFHEGQTPDEFESALGKLQPGETSDPVQTRFGYHIIKLVEVNEARQLSFEEMKGKIREKLENQQQTVLQDAWMKSLRERYPVERVAAE